MSTSLEGKPALVTGAGRGIGRAIVMGLASAGGTAALVARSAGELAETAQGVRGELGTVDILVSNAGVVWPLGLSAGPDEWAAAIAVNVVAVANLPLAVLPAMLSQKWGRIVNVSSGVVASPAPVIGGNAYVTGKAALEVHPQSRRGTGGSGVTVNAFRPGPPGTPVQAWIRGQDPARIGTALHDRFSRSYEAGILVTPEHSARSLLARLDSDATGQTWDVSGPA
jgi:3-oxoacyl-[acyl-carrier protein] reductase